MLQGCPALLLVLALSAGLVQGYLLRPNLQQSSWLLQTRVPSTPLRPPQVRTRARELPAASLVYALPVSALATLSVVSMRSSCLAVVHRTAKPTKKRRKASQAVEARPRSTLTNLS